MTSHERYNAYLVATLRARDALEAQLDDSSAQTVFPDWPVRKLAPALREDLLDLAMTMPSPPRRRTSAESLSPSAVLGALYVLEGSALGAQILKRRAAAIGLTSQFGARHLDQQTATPRAWRSYLDCLESRDLSAAEEDQCVAAAIGAFGQFERAYRSMA
jgi:heme oxygenase